MEKNFKQWHEQKEVLDQIAKRPFFSVREIWFCSLGLNIGFEQNGKGNEFIRPVLIVKKYNQETFLAIPLTKMRKNEKKYPNFYYSFSFLPGIQSTALLSQVRFLDAKRLTRKIGTLPTYIFQEIQKRLKELIP